jgi:hypothetical protein
MHRKVRLAKLAAINYLGRGSHVHIESYEGVNRLVEKMRAGRA